MIRIKLFIPILVGALLTACGGGGGGGDGETPTPDPVTDPTGSSSGGGVGTSNDSDAPVASIMFPWTAARTSSNSLTVKGIASDSGTIKAVRVNGKSATLTRNATAISTSGLAIRSSNPARLLSDGSGTDTSDAGDVVEWEVTIPVPAADDSTVVVETEDEAGNVDHAAAKASVLNRAVPTSFEIDPVNRQLVGQAWHDLFVVMGLDDDSYRTVSVPDHPFCGGFALKPDNNAIVCTTLADNQLKITSLSLDTGAQSFLFEQNLNLDPAEWLFASVWEAEVSADNSSLYLLVQYFSAVSYDDNKSVIYRYDFAGNTLTPLVDGATQSGSKFAANTFALANSGIMAINTRVAGDLGGDDSLNLIDYAGADSTSVTEAFNLTLNLVDVSADDTTAFVAGYDGIAKADIPTGTREILSLEANEQLFNIDQLDAIALDEANNRLLIGDSGFGYIFSVDTDTGARTEFAANGLGSGKHLLAPRAIELDEPNGLAYVLDDGGNAGENLIEVDLATGNRSVLAHFDFPYNYIAQDLILDSAGGRLFAVFEHEIFAVTLGDGAVTPLASSGSGYSFTGGTLDESGNRLLITETSTDSVLTLDLSTYSMTELYSSATIDVPVDVELDESSGQIYILSQANGELHAYDPDSGETTLLLNNCVEDQGRNALDINVGSVQGLHLDPNKRWMWISGDYLMRFDLESKACSVMPWKYYGYGLGNNISILDVKATSNGQLLGTKFRNLIQIDFESGELVTLSR
ncbi:hypothetical protein SAMN04487965_2565 [Microbulbifer donghaiensis]|uniref:DNA-binding beta-propeller fold protein YncE n=1 Tax=Microbulbifer donghaiensis TaxID=494016 RepID=A0A1M5E1X2_9GAMM|nr:hypothetical protein [Microbulbifer donghaiensis]SHF73176.1 hypothetical protein SAMN04487965_2565 [Microbulbifer donghaiensis]